MKSAKIDRAAACKSRFRPMRRALLFWCLFIGLGAVWGAGCMFVDPDGRLLRMDTMLPYFRVLPFADVLFRDYLFSGVAPLIVDGLTNLLAAVLLLRNKCSGVLLGITHTALKSVRCRKGRYHT